MGLAELAAEASGCRRCPAACDGKALSTANGPAPCAVMLVGEAPGRLGAGRTGVPFTLDVSARRLAKLMAAAGLSRRDVFITNGLLCAPLDAMGRNRTPATGELRSCSGWLKRQIALVDPQVVVAMGVVALKALRLIEPHTLTLGDVGRWVRWGERSLVAVYHPGARAGVHRSWTLQVEDWRRLGTRLRRSGGCLEVNGTWLIRRDTLPYEVRRDRL
jgi:uracil-DNA glycosylase family 4